MLYVYVYIYIYMHIYMLYIYTHIHKILQLPTIVNILKDIQRTGGLRTSQKTSHLHHNYVCLYYVLFFKTLSVSPVYERL